MPDPSDKSHRNDALATTRSPGATVVRSQVAPRDDYTEYREVLRRDFWYSCAYCTIAEVEAAGIRFSIDHYLPQARYSELVNSYENLMWACDFCNGRKGDRPTAAAATKGYRLFRPDFDDPDEHFERDGDTGVRHKTELVGHYTVALLDLNRQELRRLRAARERLASAGAAIVKGIRALKGMSIQDLPSSSRARFVRVRDRLVAAGKQASDELDDALLREAARSELIDPPEEPSNESAARRRFLRQVNAAVPSSRR